MNIKKMVDRFLCWTLPGNFGPDAGIKFEPTELQKDGTHAWPTGTNLFTADQAEEMFRHVTQGMEEAQAENESLRQQLTEVETQRNAEKISASFNYTTRISLEAELAALKRGDFSHVQLENESLKLANSVLKQQLEATKLDRDELEEKLEVSNLTLGMVTASRNLTDLELEATKLDAERKDAVIKLAREALEFYADGNHYDIEDHFETRRVIMLDTGEKAEEALAALDAAMGKEPT